MAIYESVCGFYLEERCDHCDGKQRTIPQPYPRKPAWPMRDKGQCRYGCGEYTNFEPQKPTLLRRFLNWIAAQESCERSEQISEGGGE